MSLASIGCATIVSGGTTEVVAVTSDPSGASVRALPTGEIATTPAELELSKANSYVLRIEKECFEEARAEIQNPVHPAMWGNILLGGLIGFVVDVSSGGGFNLEPEEVHVTLAPIENCGSK